MQEDVKNSKTWALDKGLKFFIMQWLIGCDYAYYLISSDSTHETINAKS